MAEKRKGEDLAADERTNLQSSPKRTRRETVEPNHVNTITDANELNYDDDDDDAGDGDGERSKYNDGTVSESSSTGREVLLARPPRQKPRTDPIYGQCSAFPGLDDGVDGEAGDVTELFYGPAEDGLEYLRMVRCVILACLELFEDEGLTEVCRSEANSMPMLFVAPKTETKSTDEEAARPEDEEAATQKSRYVDGVFIAPPTTLPDGDAGDEDEDEDSPQAIYYNLLKHRFLLLRSTLRCTPPAEAIASLDAAHPITLPWHIPRARKDWRRTLLSTDPLMVQLSCMDADSVMAATRLVGRVLAETVRSGDAVKVRRIGAWVWGLLGKCREVGQLSSEEVGDLRELGKRAIGILEKLNRQSAPTPETIGKQADSDGGAEGSSDGEETGDEKARESAEGKPQSDSNFEADKIQTQDHAREASGEERPREQSVTNGTKRETTMSQGEDKPDAACLSRAMLDMIITIVGEFYGQRDLLLSRDTWR